MWKKVVRLLAVLVMGPLALAAWASAEERFIDHGDGTLTDRRLGVMWSSADNQGNIDWKSAERWAQFTFPLSLPADKREGWRLPRLEELESLYVEGEAGYESDCGQWVRIVPAIRLSCGWVWASEKRSISALVFNFQRGYHYTDRMVHLKAYRALAVRSLGPQ